VVRKEDGAPAAPTTLLGWTLLGVLAVTDPLISVLILFVLLVPAVLLAFLVAGVFDVPTDIAAILGVVLAAAVLLWIFGLGKAITRQWNKDRPPD
jgi:hypothetical protein